MLETISHLICVHVDRAAAALTSASAADAAHRRTQHVAAVTHHLQVLNLLGEAWDSSFSDDWSSMPPADRKTLRTRLEAAAAALFTAAAAATDLPATGTDDAADLTRVGAEAVRFAAQLRTATP